MAGTLHLIAQELLVGGERLRSERTIRSEFFHEIHVVGNTGDTAISPALSPLVRALSSSARGRRPGEAALSFGPGAGLVIAVSLGKSSARAAVVDANGWIYCQEVASEMRNQLSLSPDELFRRIRQLCDAVMSRAWSEEADRLLIDGQMPFLGLAVSWPTPLDRDKQPRGEALSHPDFHNVTEGLQRRLARHLKINPARSHALNDAAATALAVAFDHTRSREHRESQHTEIFFVLRVSGGIGASMIGVEPMKLGGWAKSGLRQGRRELGGEIGHADVSQPLVELLSRRGPSDSPALVSVPCSCADGDDASHHLESYASSRALAERFRAAPDELQSEILERVLERADVDPYKSALQDAGLLLAEALIPALLMINPDRIVLTGQLAHAVVSQAIEDRLHQGSIVKLIGEIPRVTPAPEPDGLEGFTALRGAGLAVFRTNVHRRLDHLYGASRELIPERFRELVELWSEPWQT